MRWSLRQAQTELAADAIADGRRCSRVLRHLRFLRQRVRIHTQSEIASVFYYIMKTGLSMFDPCRAYGLALVLDRLGAGISDRDCVQIEDLGGWFRLTGPDISSLPSGAPWGAFDDLLAASDGWCGVLLTTGRTPAESRLSRIGRKNVLGKVEIVRQVLQQYPARLHFYMSPVPCDMRSSLAAGFCSLPASLDASAVKGVRRPKLNTSTIGDQLYVPEEEWAIALLGGATFVRWVWTHGDYLALLPEPRRIYLRDHQAACAMENTGYVCGAAPRAAAAHHSIRLIRALDRIPAGHDRGDCVYGNMIFQGMAFVGNQWKSKSGGVFPLELLLRIGDSSSEVADRLLSMWDSLFRWASADGNGALGVALADFLADPSLARFGHYVRTHSALAIRDGQAVPSYQASWFGALLQLLGQPGWVQLVNDPYVSRVGQALGFLVGVGGECATAVELRYVGRSEDLSGVLNRFLRRYTAYARGRYNRGLGALFLRVDDIERVVSLARTSPGAVRLTAMALLAHTFVR
jgi:hypothetical protein